MKKIVLMAVLGGLTAWGNTDAADWRPAERWRGFNLLEMFIKGKNAQPKEFRESDFRLIHQWGFNFVRLPMDYRFWITDGDWEKIDETAVGYIDRAIALGKKWNVHVQVCMHRCPGYTVARPREARDLFTDPEALRVCARHWAYFAKRWKDIPNETLSFNLFNEPPKIADEVYGRVAKALIAAIRAEDPKRFIMVDGLSYGRLPLEAVAGMPGVGQATRGYTPMSVSHYKASWVGTPTAKAKPVWPLPLDAPAGVLTGKGKADMRAKLELFDLPAGTVRVAYGRVSGQVTVRFAADGAVVREETFDPRQKTADWSDVKFFPEWNNICQGVYRGVTEIALPQGAKTLTAEVASGDWIYLSTVTVTDTAGRSVDLPVANEWKKPTGFRQRYDAAARAFVSLDAATRPVHSADAGRDYLYHTCIAPWEKVMAGGTCVMAGEFGVYSFTPHPIVLDIVEDYLALWKEKNMGWAMWNFRGPFGILDSGRSDVAYEDCEGLKLDRKLLELLRRY